MCVCVCVSLAGEGWGWKVGMEWDFKMEMNPPHNITADGECSHEALKDAYSLEGKLWPT